MRAKFIHVADVHLGYEQYGVRERFNDFTRAFWEIVDEAIARQADFVIIAGDLFNKRAIDARTLIHAIEGLRKLKDRQIPVIAIEGNHDRSYYRDGLSWLQFLCHQGFLTLLAPQMREGAPLISAWDAQTMLGSHLDVLDGRVRVYGLPWQGSATARSLEGMAQALATARADEDAEGQIEYRLLMMHTGVEGVIPRLQGLPTMAQFQQLRHKVDYLALGHVHKPYEFEGWIYNPGSPETWSAEESQWEDRGYYFVEIDTEPADSTTPLPLKHRAQHLANNRRPFIRYNLAVEDLRTPQELYERLEEYCRREAPRHADDALPPVVQISLIGTLSFDAGSLDQTKMEDLVKAYFKPLHGRVDNNTNDQDYIPDTGELDGRDRSTWHELERRIFEELIARDNRYLPVKEHWSVVLADLKERALQHEDPTEIARYLREKRAELLTPTTPGTPVPTA